MQVGGLHAYREQYFEDTVECLGTRQIMPPPSTEKSHGIDSDYRFGSAFVRAVEVIGDELTLPHSLQHHRIAVLATVTHSERSSRHPTPTKRTPIDIRSTNPALGCN
jgi:hypothetical protein